MQLRKDSIVSVSQYGWRVPRLRHALLGLLLTGVGLVSQVWGQRPQADAPRAHVALPQVEVPRQLTLETAQRYRGLRGGQHVAISDGDAGLLVRPEVARRQLNAETPAPRGIFGSGSKE